MDQTSSLHRLSMVLPISTISLLGHVLALDGANIYRAYTPLEARSSDYFDILVKRYTNGRISSCIHRLEVGDEMDFVSMKSHFSYSPNSFDTLGMIAGGTGVAPMMQLIHAILANPQDQTNMKLLFACHSPETAYFKNELDSLVQQFPSRLEVHYVFGGAPFDRPVLTDLLPASASLSSLLVSGPPSMITGLCGEGSEEGEVRAKQPPLGGLLKAAGFADEQVWIL